MTGCTASRETADQPEEAVVDSVVGEDEFAPYAEVITGEAETDEGVFTVHRLDDKVYYEIPDSLLGKEMLLVTRIARTAANAGYGGQKAHTHVVRWQRQHDSVLLRVVSYESVADPDQPIYEAVRNASFEPIIKSFDIKAQGEEKNTVVVEVTDLFTSDVPALGLQEGRREAYKVRRLDPERTYVQSVNSFPRNLEVRNVLTYEAGDPPSSSSTGTLSMEMHHSMVLLPADPMSPRPCDERMGYFSVQMTDYGVDAQEAVEKCYITRWRLEPSDMQAFQRGELVEPKEPIVYYIDPATPKKWRPYLKEGVEAWNKAFREAGFKNAIRAKDPPSPKEDPAFNPEDVRYSVIRYFPSKVQNAYGPHVHDPRTGEILESDIGWYHNVMSLLRNWYFVQTAAANPKARFVSFDEEVMGQLIKFVAAHEVGHTLGLAHNWGSSYAYPVDSLRSPTFTSTHGTAPSIMDYARFNYVAQPGDDVTNFMPKIGTYDTFAIRWGYRPIPRADTNQEEERILDRWIRRHADDPAYFYGRQSGAQIDPRSQREDLGNNAVKASRYGIQNLKRIVPQLVDWTYREGENYEELSELYQSVISQWRLYIGHVARQIGGVYETPKTYDQEGAVYEVVPPERQRAAMAFLQERVFETPEWLLHEEVLRRIERAGALERVQSAQAGALQILLDPDRLRRMAEAEAMGENTYAPAAMLADLRQGIWKELDSGAPIDAYRRNLQRSYLQQMGQLIAGDAASDARAYARGELVTLQESIQEALSQLEDRSTRLHLKDVMVRIEDMLEPDEESDE